MNEAEFKAACLKWIKSDANDAKANKELAKAIRSYFNVTK